MNLDRDRLDALLGGPEAAWLRGRVRARLERAEPLTGVVTLTEPDDSERAAVDRLLGRRPSTGASVTVPLAEVDRLLRRAGICDGLPAAVQILDGPVVDRAACRAAERAAWREAFTAVDPTELGAWGQAWLDELTRSGVLRRLATDAADAGALLRDAATVLTSLPADAVERPRLAAELLGDSHALDDDRPVSTLVLKALHHRHHGDGGALPTGEERRALWATAGVLVGELASTVLVHGLRPTGDGLTDRTLVAHAAAGEPARLTLRQLVRHPPQLTSYRATRVYVCENPAVVSAAASRHGGACAPLVCTEGHPSAATQSLLLQLAHAGARTTYHGDFDWAGLAIGNLMIERFGTTPWRFGSVDYVAAPDGPPLTGRPVDPVWDRDLADRMTARGVAVHEEQVLTELLSDLG